MTPRQLKQQALKDVGAFYSAPERVRAPLFLSHPFFDPEDKVQVKYEMLRHREVEAGGLLESCRQFGFTRESYRHIRERFVAEGMSGLFERKRGRRGALKVKDEVRTFLLNERVREPGLSPEEVSRRCFQQTGVKISRRTIYRVWGQEEPAKKKRRSAKTRK